MRRDRWEKIQHGEFDYHAAKAPRPFLEHKLEYWKAFLATLPDEVKLSPGARVLDVGCGGASVVLALEGSERYGLDPLIGRYREQFAYLDEQSGVHWIEAAAEDATFDHPFDVVFAINSFDHVFDPALAARCISDWVRPGGHLVVTMNTHNTRFFRAYYAALYRLIDHHHPYQFRAADIVALFPDLTPIDVREIDDLWLGFAAGYYREVLGRPVEDKRKWLRAARNPFKWPMGVSKFLFNMPPHKKRAGQRAIYSERLFVFRR